MDERLSGFAVVTGVCDDCEKPFSRISTTYRCDCETRELKQKIKELEQKIAASNDSEELMPCPCCGGRAEVVRIFGRIGIECSQCNICIRSEQICGEEGYDSIFEAWNKRVETELKDRSREEIQALIEKYGNPQYKTNEFALYDLIGVSQQLLNNLTATEADKEQLIKNSMATIEQLVIDNEATEAKLADLQSNDGKLKNSVHKLLVEQDKAVDLQIQLTDTEAKFASAVKALEKYGNHSTGCLAFMKKQRWSGFECACGLEDVVAQMKKGSEG